MDLLAAPHPFCNRKQPCVSPPHISEILWAPESEMPPDSWHIGFSRAGDLLYFSDNAPDFFGNTPTLKGLDAFLEELGHWINYKDFQNYETFRAKLFTETRSDTVVRVNRMDPSRPPMLGIACRKHANGFHMVCVAGRDGETNTEIVLKPGFFKNEDDFLKESKAWLETVDEDTLSGTAVDAFQQETARTPIPTATIRTLSGKLLKVPPYADPDQIPRMPGTVANSGRWWGSLIENAATRPRDYWVHTMIRCGRILPVVTVSVNTGSIEDVGMTFFSNVLARMSEAILDCAKGYTASAKYRYAKYWKGYEGYDLQKAEHVLELVSKDSGAVSIIPIHTTNQDLLRVSRKIRLDEPYFWDEKRSEVWVVLRNTSVENAELMVRPSLIARLDGSLVGTPQTVESFILKYCHE